MREPRFSPHSQMNSNCLPSPRSNNASAVFATATTLFHPGRANAKTMRDAYHQFLPRLSKAYLLVLRAPRSEAPSAPPVCHVDPLVVLALVELGVPMPAELLDDWFGDSGEVQLSAAS